MDYLLYLPHSTSRMLTLVSVNFSLLDFAFLWMRDEGGTVLGEPMTMQ